MKRSVFWTGASVLVVTSISIFVEVTYGHAVDPPVPQAAQIDGGRLTIVEGVPVVHLEGTHFEIGRQHGALLKEQIHFLHKEYGENFMFPLVGEQNIREWAETAESFIPQKYIEEMRGIAEGSGISYEKTLQINCAIDRLQSLFCSTVTASGDATKDGDVIFGRNLDFAGRGILHKATVVLVMKPDGETPLLSVTWPGLIGVLSGMNGRGVAVATMMIHRFLKKPTPGTPYMILYREALARAHEAADVYDVLAAGKRTGPNNLMVADAAGTSYVVEFDATRIAKRPAQDGGACGTNYFLSKELEGVGHPVGRDRFRDLERFLEEEYGKIDVESVRKVLQKVARPWFVNVQSMIFLPRQRAMYISVGGRLPAAEQPFVKLNRDLLFGAWDSGK
jgi:hypothetical protein